MAKIFHIETAASGVVPGVTRIDRKDLKDNLSPTLRYKSIGQWTNGKIPFAKDKTRNAHVHLFACEGNRWNLPFDFLVENLIKDYEEEGFTAAEIITTVQSAFKRNEHERGKFLIDPPVPVLQDLKTVAITEEKEWYSAKEMANEKPPADIWMLENWIRRIGVTYWLSLPGLGKSTMLRQLLIHLVYGLTEFLGIFLKAKKFKGIYCSMEDARIDILAGFQSQLKALGVEEPDENLQALFPRTKEIDLVLAKCKQKVTEMGGIDLLILDPNNSLYSMTGKDVKDPMAQRLFNEKVEDAARELQCAIIMIHHPLKSGYSQHDNMTLAHVPGTGSIEAARCIHIMSKMPSINPGYIYLRNLKGNYIRSWFRDNAVEISCNEDLYIFSATGKIIPLNGGSGASREGKKQDAIEKRKKTITEIFTVNGTLQHGQFCQLYQEKTQLSLVSAARHLVEMVKESIVVHDELTGLYSLKIEAQVLNAPPILTNVEIKNNEVMAWVDENYENCPF